MQIIDKQKYVEPFYLAVAMGKIPGHSVYRKFGENPDIDSGSGFEDIWDVGGSYVPPTVARTHNIASSAAADAGTLLSSGTLTAGTATSATDTGATFVSDGVAVGDLFLDDTDVEIGVITGVTETVLTMADSMHHPGDGRPSRDNTAGDSYRVVTDASTGGTIAWIEGLDGDKLFQEEFVILNGTSNVATASAYLRQFRCRIWGAGSTTDTAGVISSTAQTDGTITLQVLAGHNQTLQAIYTVPDNQTGYLIQWWGSLSKKQTTISNIRLRVGQLDSFNYITQTRELISVGDSSFDYIYPAPIPIPGGSDVWVEADASADNTGVTAGFEILLVDN